ncbi:hypothetical protein QE152_g201 [Popillia japonica]|uniref:Uncharacterized protein n=1 Tax=Popillia japonica TaxID=7064 RepID=A0AAW1NKY8_POPJA
MLTADHRPPHPYYHQPYGQYPPHLGRPHPYAHGGPPDGQHVPTGPDDHGPPRMYGGMPDSDRPPNEIDNSMNQSSDPQGDDKDCKGENSHDDGRERKEID